MQLITDPWSRHNGVRTFLCNSTKIRPLTLIFLQKFWKNGSNLPFLESLKLQWLVPVSKLCLLLAFFLVILGNLVQARKVLDFWRLHKNKKKCFSFNYPFSDNCSVLKKIMTGLLIWVYWFSVYFFRNCETPKFKNIFSQQ